MHCLYYQAKVNVPYTWFIGGVFRNEDNLVFERTLENSPDTLEFFVPEGQEEEFLHIVQYLVAQGYIFSYEKLPNRIIET